LSFNELKALVWTTLNLGYYFTENIKAFAEYWDQLDVPSSVERDSRFTLQLEVAF